MSHALLQSWQLFMQAQSLSQRTISERLSTLSRLSAAVGSLETATPLEIAAWLGGLSVAAASRATYYGHLAAFFEWLQTVELRTENPMLKVPKTRRPKPVPRPVPPDSIPAIVAAATRRKTRMMVLLAAYAGLRVHEIAKIRGEDVDLAAGTLFVDGKGGIRAMVPLHDEIRAFAPHFPASGFWFPGRGHGHILHNSVSMLIGRCMKRAGVTGTAHQLRHWYGTALLAAGADIRVVQELMRHRSIQSTTIYTAVNDEQRRAAIDRLAA